MAIASLDLMKLSPRQMGRAHGEAFREEIQELAEIRLALLERRSTLQGTDKLLELAAAHLPVLQACDADLYAELEGLGEGANLDLARLVVLNHYTDIRDVRAPETGEEGGCSLLYGRGESGPILGQTWDMHGTAEPFVLVLNIHAPGSIPVTIFTVMGCLGMMGLNGEGVAVCINNLTPTDARIGILWPALVRQLLRFPSAEGALSHLMEAPLGSGHNYFIADSSHAWNVETTGERKVITSSDPVATYGHTNHYLAAELKALEAPLYPTSTTLERYDSLCDSMMRIPPGEWTVDAMKTVLGSHEGYPRSICSHLKGDGDPSASKTCGAVICDVNQRELHAAPGCVHEAHYSLFRPGK